MTQRVVRSGDESPARSGVVGDVAKHRVAVVLRDGREGDDTLLDPEFARATRGLLTRLAFGECKQVDCDEEHA